MIDVHAHVVFEALFGAAGEHGPEATTDDGGRPRFRVGDYVLDGVAYRETPFVDAGRRLAAMDAVGIDFQVLSPNPLTYFHHIDPDTAAAYCRRHNDLLADVVAAHPARLGGLAALPMQDPAAAAVELRRAVDELGLLGAQVGTDVGRPLDDPSLDAFYGTVAALDVPLFLHPAPPELGGSGDARFRRFDLGVVVGFAGEETLAAAALLYGGVLTRHPRLDVCLSHGGGAVPFLYGRLREAARVRPWSPPELRRDGAFEALFARLWWDCLVHDDRAFRLLADVAPPDRLVAGTNFAGWDQTLPPADDDLRARLAGNARRLLRLDRR